MPLTIDLVLGGLSCLGVWVRRRRPVGLAVVAGLVIVYATSAAGLGMIALFTVAVHRPLAVVVPVVAGYALVPLATLLVRPDLPASAWSHVVIGVLCVVAVLAWGMFVRARRQSLHERNRRIESEREPARRRAGAATGGSPEEVARAAGVIRASVYQALEDLREVIGVLRADRDGAEHAPERPQPTLADIPALVDQSRRAGMRVLLDCRLAEPTAAPDAVGRNAYRIVQEGLTNAHKHARDAEVSVTVRPASDDGLTVEIRNPCPACTTSDIPGGGAGLIGLTERVRSPADDCGTVTLPRATSNSGRGCRGSGERADPGPRRRRRPARPRRPRDDHRRDGLKVVGEAGDGADVLAAVDAGTPDVVLMDIRMPVLDGLAATEQLRSRPDPPEIIVLTTFDTDEHVHRALRAGASRFLLKHTPPAGILRAIFRVAEGEPMLSPTVTRQLIAHLGHTGADARRQAEIGRELFMSVATVKAHVSRILTKLDRDNRTQIALLSHDAGLTG